MRVFGYIQIRSIHIVLLMILIHPAMCLAAVGQPQPNISSSIPVIPTTIELIADHQDPYMIHGWHSNHLIRYKGKLYVSGTIHDEKAPNGWKRTSTFYQREKDGKWSVISVFPQWIYSMLVDPKGIFWAVAPSDYTDTNTYRMTKPLNFQHFDRVYDGSCFYLGAGISPEGNVLILHAETGDMDVNVPNAIISQFYDHASGKWYKGQRMVTPEGRYGYIGLIVQGRRALAVMISAVRDPKANPVAPYYSWRHVRLARCNDLIKGEWKQVPWLMPEFGWTDPQDMTTGPDGSIYFVYRSVTGSSFQEASTALVHQYIVHIRWDLTTEVFPTGLDDVAPARLLIDHRGGWHLAGRKGDMLHLWDLDAKNRFKPTHEYLLQGTEKLESYVMYTLRPERFGGESDGDIIHLVSDGFVSDPSDAAKKSYAQLWHCSFRLPSAGKAPSAER